MADKGVTITVSGVTACGKSTCADWVVRTLREKNIPVILGEMPEGDRFRLEEMIYFTKAPSGEWPVTLNIVTDDKPLQVITDLEKTEIEEIRDALPETPAPTSQKPPEQEGPPPPPKGSVTPSPLPNTPPVTVDEVQKRRILHYIRNKMFAAGQVWCEGKADNNYLRDLEAEMTNQFESVDWLTITVYPIEVDGDITKVKMKAEAHSAFGNIEVTCDCTRSTTKMPWSLPEDEKPTKEQIAEATMEDTMHFGATPNMATLAETIQLLTKHQGHIVSLSPQKADNLMAYLMDRTRKLTELEDKLDIIVREMQGDDPAELAADHGGSGLELSPEVQAVRKEKAHLEAKHENYKREVFKHCFHPSWDGGAQNIELDFVLMPEGAIFDGTVNFIPPMPAACVMLDDAKVICECGWEGVRHELKGTEACMCPRCNLFMKTPNKIGVIKTEEELIEVFGLPKEDCKTCGGTGQLPVGHPGTGLIPGGTTCQDCKGEGKKNV